jgi:tetratricopeptide (TPR) repeat protein
MCGIIFKQPARFCGGSHDPPSAGRKATFPSYRSSAHLSKSLHQRTDPSAAVPARRPAGDRWRSTVCPWGIPRSHRCLQPRPRRRGNPEQNRRRLHHLSAVDLARTSYEKALALRPNFPDALNNLGATWFAEKKYSRAIRLYRRALQLSPDSAVTAANLGTAYFAQGKAGPGIEAYRAAFSLDSTVFDLDSPSIVNGPITDQERAQQDYCIAELFAEMHNQSRALEYLRKAFSAGFRDAKRIWQDPAFGELRLSADFASLMGEIGLK